MHASALLLHYVFDYVNLLEERFHSKVNFVLPCTNGFVLLGKIVFWGEGGGRVDFFVSLV